MKNLTFYKTCKYQVYKFNKENTLISVSLKDFRLHFRICDNYSFGKIIALNITRILNLLSLTRSQALFYFTLS